MKLKNQYKKKSFLQGNKLCTGNKTKQPMKKSIGCFVSYKMKMN